MFNPNNPCWQDNQCTSNSMFSHPPLLCLTTTLNQTNYAVYLLSSDEMSRTRVVVVLTCKLVPLLCCTETFRHHPQWPTRRRQIITERIYLELKLVSIIENSNECSSSQVDLCPINWGRRVVVVIARTVT